MNKTIQKALLSGLLILNVNNAFAAHSDVQSPPTSDKEPTQCISLIRECFSYHGFNRSNCFFTSATHPFCEGSELGSLAYRRWVLSPSEPQGENLGDGVAKAVIAQGESAQAFLGPQIVDPSCIENIDKNLESSLRIETVSIETVRKLTQSLESCKRDIGLELHRQ